MSEKIDHKYLLINGFTYRLSNTTVSSHRCRNRVPNIQSNLAKMTELDYDEDQEGRTQGQASGEESRAKYNESEALCVVS